MRRSRLNSSNDHAWGLKPTYGEVVSYGTFMEKKKGFQGLDFFTLAETVARLGHTGRMIDIFKIDCEGCEWSTLKDLLDKNIQQILVEVHSVYNNSDQFFDDLHDGGYVTFHKEPNLPSGAKCIEFSFLKLAKAFFLVKVGIVISSATLQLCCLYLTSRRNEADIHKVALFPSSTGLRFLANGGLVYTRILHLECSLFCYMH